MIQQQQIVTNMITKKDDEIKLLVERIKILEKEAQEVNKKKIMNTSSTLVSDMNSESVPFLSCFPYSNSPIIPINPTSRLYSPSPTTHFGMFQLLQQHQMENLLRQEQQQQFNISQRNALQQLQATQYQQYLQTHQKVKFDQYQQKL